MHHKDLIPQAALKKHIAILGMNGSGKTSVAKSQIIEPALANGERVCNIDPTGVGWGLRLSANGKRKGFPIYIVGGDHADFPLVRRDGKAWAEIVGTSSDSFVFDTSAMTVEDRSQWFTDFAETLIRKNKGPLKLVLDEAHLFAPQGGSKSGGVAPRMLHSTNNLLALGRSRGLRITMISQRPAKLHKDSLTQAHTLIAMALMAPQDRAAVKDWIADQADAERGKEIIASLPSLSPGEGWIWAPKENVLDRVKFSLPMTFDSSAAPDDAEGSTVELSPVNPEAIKAKLATVAKETLANDPAALKAEIGKLRAELSNSERKRQRDDVPKRDPKDIEAAEARGFEEAKKKLADASEREVADRVASTLAEISDAVDAAIKKTGTAVVDLRAKVVRSPPLRAVQPIAIVPARVSMQTAADDRPLGAERKPLAALASVYPAGMTDGQWRVAAGFKLSGTWSTYLGRLRSAGRIEERGDLTFATEQGIADLGGNIPTMPPPGQELVGFWISKISGIGPMLRRLAEIYPEWTTREQLAADIGLVPTSGTFSTYLGRLKTPGLIETTRDKQVRAASLLMEGKEAA
jgi:Skp family chaperone for outer membrane proteins